MKQHDIWKVRLTVLGLPARILVLERFRACKQAAAAIRPGLTSGLLPSLSPGKASMANHIVTEGMLSYTWNNFCNSQPVNNSPLT